MFTLGRGIGVGEAREKIEGQQFTRGVKNTNMTDCISSLLTLLNTSTDDIQVFVFIVPSSMTGAMDEGTLKTPIP
jgi:hypothetical protein